MCTASASTQTLLHIGPPALEESSIYAEGEHLQHAVNTPVCLFFYVSASDSFPSHSDRCKSPERSGRRRQSLSRGGQRVTVQSSSWGGRRISGYIISSVKRFAGSPLGGGQWGLQTKTYWFILFKTVECITDKYPDVLNFSSMHPDIAFNCGWVCGLMERLTPLSTGNRKF